MNCPKCGRDIYAEYENYHFAVKVNTLKLRTITLSLMENTQVIGGMLNVYVHDVKKNLGSVIPMCRKRGYGMIMICNVPDVVVKSVKMGNK